jgi:hypothetical protein
MKGMTTMSDEQPVYREGETVPVPDKGGWIDGETGAVIGGPPPEPPDPPITRQGKDEPETPAGRRPKAS